MVALHRREIKKKKKNLGWTLGLLPETVGLILYHLCRNNDAPPCRYYLFGGGGGRDRRASRKAIYFKLKIEC